MATFAEIKARVADELERNDLSSQIETAVLDAQEFYAHLFLGFNERRGLAATLAGSEFASLPAGLRHPKEVSVQVSGNDYTLLKRSTEYLEHLHNASDTSGQPAFYAVLDREFRIWPTPDAQYTLTVLGVYDDSALSADADTNDFTTNAMATNMLVHWAKEYIARNILIDAEQTQAAFAQRTIAERNFRERVNRLNATGVIQPSW